MKSDLLNALENYAGCGRIPMHMPGHKRNGALFPELVQLGAELDITEIDGFDNLHGACGILGEAMARASRLWHSDRSYFLVNGSSCGILAGIRALTRRGDTVLVSRASHKSVYHAMELCGLRPVFLMPETDGESGLPLSISPAAVEEALQAHPETALVILCSPTYEGVVSDVASIAQIAHDRHIPLLVDEAHGAHLSLHPAFPAGAVFCGADVVVQSLHKTLPSLTQTAILHVRRDLVDTALLEHQLYVCEKSSPSYLLLASMDACVSRLAGDGAVMDGWAQRIADFDNCIKSMTHLRIPGHNAPLPDGVFAYDPSKIWVFVSGTSMSGGALGAFLREAGIEPEMIGRDGVLLMTGAGDRAEDLRRVADALRQADARCTGGAVSPPSPMRRPRSVLDAETALSCPWEMLPLGEAVGRLSAEYVWAYPPGIPLLVPGERVEADVVLQLSKTEVELHSTRGNMPDAMAVVKET